MVGRLLICIVLSFLFYLKSFSQEASKIKDGLVSSIESKYSKYRDAALKIWDFAEVGYKEYKSSGLLQEMLSKEGFEIESGVSAAAAIEIKNLLKDYRD